MGVRRFTTPRSQNCDAPTHSMWARQRLGCTCPPSDEDRAFWRRASAARATGERRVRVSLQADVDDIAVERLTAGETPAAVTRAERLAAVQLLTERGLSMAQIAERLAVNPRTVSRYRATANVTRRAA